MSGKGHKMKAMIEVVAKRLCHYAEGTMYRTEDETWDRARDVDKKGYRHRGADLVSLITEEIAKELNTLALGSTYLTASVIKEVAESLRREYKK